MMRSKPMFTGLSGEMNPAWANWSYVDRLKKMTNMKLILEGIDTAEDAVLAREHGADGVVVSKSRGTRNRDWPGNDRHPSGRG
jgi:isopentenyl diphosphate isomerase/L-lactate dehydrogenase-like FMN-dependent dehydrogenase